jgi:hypothetical protein
MEITGYGEDPLTYLAISNEETVKGIFHQLESQIQHKEDIIQMIDTCKIYYKPSFGRGGNSGKNFGEFDAIIATKENIFLVESKWFKYHGFPEVWPKAKAERSVANKLIPVGKPFDPKEIQRHKIFEMYYKGWAKILDSNFRKRLNFEFSKFGKQIIGPDSEKQMQADLYVNMKYMIAEFGKEKQINNVLLYFVPKILEDKFGVELQPVLKEANYNGLVF